MASPVASGPPPVPHRALITICAMAATLMQALDSTIANVALPYMQGSLSASTDQITWVLTSYITAAAIMTAPVGWLSDAVRPKNVFLICAGRLHRHLDAVRHRRIAGADGAVPVAAGRVRRGAGAAVAGHHAGHLPARASAARPWRSGAWA